MEQPRTGHTERRESLAVPRSAGQPLADGLTLTAASTPEGLAAPPGVASRAPAPGPTVAPGKIRRRYGTNSYLMLLAAVIFVAWVLSSFDSTMVGVAGPELTKAYGISPSALLYGVSGILVTGLIASVAAGILMDRYGRKRVFTWVLAGVGLFSGLVAVVGTFWQFLIVRALADTTQGGILPAANTLVAEESTPQFRGRLQGLTLAGYALGSALAGTIAAHVLGHFSYRVLFLFAFIPMLFVLVISRYLRESSRYVDMRREQQTQPKATKVLTGESVALVFSKRYRRQSLLLIAYGFLPAGLAIYVAAVMPLYLATEQHLSPGTIASLISYDFYVSIAGNFVSAALADYISAKWVMVSFPAIGALFFIPFLIPGAGYTAILLAMLGAGFFGQGVYAAYAVCVPASFPSQVRGTATGIVLTGTSLGGIVLPLTAAPLIDLGHPLAIPLLTLIIPILAVIVALFTKRTSPRRDLDDTALEVAEPAPA